MAYLMKVYASAVVIQMTMDSIKGLNSFVSLQWFFNWGCPAALFVICAVVTYGEFAGINFDTIDTKEVN